MPEDFIADDHLAAFLRTARAQPTGGEPDVATSRQASRARAAARTPGPEVPAVDTTMAGVPVRVYAPGADPVVVYLHGGGFVLGDLDTHDARARRLAVATAASAEHDPLRDEGEAYVARLRAAGVPVTHRREPGLVHDFPTLRDVSSAAAAAEDRFLRDAAQLLGRRSS
ncbi:alpha/beta hydrolase fold domain-containing protein [Micromonospora sp. NPDC005305]|uniref:alpha/beta hydrolase fold domain-containing protein n=1 Tax=Micromonospora sp. NPDC005305 TaxID=3156875 RepID=UPI0033AF927D